MKLIPLGGKVAGGKLVKVSDKDYDWLSSYRWCAAEGRNGVLYAVRRTSKAEGDRVVSMHREVTKAVKGEFVDHHNGDGLDNQRMNLRVCTNKQNVTNARIRRDNTSGYKNVSWNSRRRKWKVQAAFDSNVVYIGLFEDLHFAAVAADLWEMDLHGEFARTNFKVVSWG